MFAEGGVALHLGLRIWMRCKNQWPGGDLGLIERQAGSRSDALMNVCSCFARLT